jgi:hypothetical protein
MTGATDEQERQPIVDALAWGRAPIAARGAPSESHHWE